jgi:hypothetical protein
MLVCAQNYSRHPPRAWDFARSTGGPAAGSPVPWLSCGTGDLNHGTGLLDPEIQRPLADVRRGRRARMYLGNSGMLATVHRFVGRPHKKKIGRILMDVSVSWLDDRCNTYFK